MGRKPVEARLDRRIAIKAAKAARCALTRRLKDGRLTEEVRAGKFSWEVTTDAISLQAGNVSVRNILTDRSHLIIDRMIDLAHPPVTEEAVDLLRAIAALAPPQ